MTYLTMKGLIAKVLLQGADLLKLKRILAIAMFVLVLPDPGNGEFVKLNKENDFSIVEPSKALPYRAPFENQKQDMAPAIIPLPDSYLLSEYNRGKFFYLKASTPILLGNDVAKLINPWLRKQWQEYFQKNTQLLLGVAITFPFYEKGSNSIDTSKPGIILHLAKPDIGKIKEGAYHLTITPDQVLITASDQAGFFYGLVSLLQLGGHHHINQENNHQRTALNARELRIPCWQIRDQPSYAWRGFMLDESRHFFGKVEVEKLLTWMAYYKLNRFHWHLTDEPGWRVQINAYPRLTAMGGIGNKTDATAPAKYYTQADIKEVVTYAKALGITVIPEIDMPGHATAANRAYPEYSGGGTGKFANFTFNPGKDSTYRFLTTILREIQGLFGADMVHLGGDEVSFGNGGWDKLPAVKKLMTRQHLKDNKAVAAYFLQRMADSALQFNEKILTWDEGVDAGLDPQNTIICWWRHDKINALKNAIEQGYDVVMCPRIPLYFDFIQDSLHKVGRKWGGKYASLKQVFDFNPGEYTRNMNKKGRVLGIQANLWTETVQTVKRLDFMLFPRMAALAAAGWTKAPVRQFGHFENTLKLELYLYDKAGISYYNPFEPGRTPEVKQ